MAGARRERKVVTVLFADLVGFTARAESLDPEDVDAFLRPYHERLRAELERWGGTVEKFIGDAVVAVFGAPTAREDDPERAVRAALAIRDWATEQGDVEVRIAVNTGEALVSLDVRPETGEGFVTGDVVNTASRMQSAAPVNGIVVGEQTFRATRDLIDHRELEPLQAKGKSRPVPVWEALEARSRFGVDVRQHGAAPLVGRARELDALVATLDRVKNDREPQLVTLVGVPGIGKSRLVWELFESIGRGEDLVYWRQGRSLPYGEGISFWALSEIVKAHAGVLEDDEEQVVAEKLERAVADVVSEDADWVAARLRTLVGAGESTSRDESFTAWRTFFESLAEVHPLALVFEDVHWADDGLLDFVDHLVDWATGVPLLVLCTARPELLDRRPGWGGGKLNALTLALGPLSDDDSARLLAAVLDRAVLPAATQQALLERASGNPLYAEQFARLYLERGSVDDGPLPETVHGLIAARLDTLPREEKALLQDAAVMGKVFWSGALSDDGDLGTHLHALERKEFIRRDRRSSVADQDEFGFRHVLVRDVAYGQIPRANRAEKHLRAAAWIEALGRPQDHAELVANHYVAARELGAAGAELDERAARALRAAGDRAFALNGFTRAAELYRSALELAGPEDPDRPEVLFRLGRSESHATGGGKRILLEAADGFEAAGERESAAEALTLAALGGYIAGDDEGIDELLERAARLVEGSSASRAKAAVLSNQARQAYLIGRYGASLEAGEQALAMAESLGLDDIRSEALLYVGGSRWEEGDPAGLDLMRESFTLATSINDPVLAARACNNLAIILRFEGRLAESLEMMDGGRRLAERFGMTASVRFAEGGRVFRLFELGRWSETLDSADAFLGPDENDLAKPNVSSVFMARAMIRLSRDEISGALADSERMLETALMYDTPLSVIPGMSTRAFILVSVGQLDEAREMNDRVREYRTRVDRFSMGAGAWAIWSWQQLGTFDETLAAMGAGRRTPWLEAAEAVAAEGWATAAEVYGRCGARGDEAFARLQAGGDDELRRALSFFREVGATRYIREAEAGLAAIA